MEELFYYVLTVDNGLRAGLWLFVIGCFLFLLSRIYIDIKDKSAKTDVMMPDQSGRYPIIRIKTKIGTVLYDKDNAFGLHIIRKDGEINTVDAPDTVLASYRDIEIARADSFRSVPTQYHYAPADTYAPTNSTDSTLVDNDAGGDTGQQTLERLLLSAPKKDYPKFIDFFEYIDQRESGHIMVGLDNDGSVIQLPMMEIFHQIIGGQSGFGKSAYLRSLTLQLLMEAETTNLKIGLADIENNTFPEFRNKDHINWYAGNYLEIEQMTKMMLRELESRKKLYEEFGTGTPKDVERYNIMARREGKPELPVIVIMYDEFTALMNRTQAIQKRIIGDIYQLALRARKYGIFLVIAGHSFKADVLDSTVVGQFAFNVCFRVRTVHTSISVLGEGGAEAINEPGVALIRTKGGDIQEIKAFYLDDDALIDYLDTMSSTEIMSNVPEIVRQIVLFAHVEHANKVLFREVNGHFKEEDGITKTQIHDAMRWMDENGFVTRNGNNARVLNGDNSDVIALLETL